jgi:hypothetical protein
MRHKYLSSSQLWLGCMCSLATLSEPAWGSPIAYANSVGWLAEPAISSSRFLPAVTFGTVLSDRSSKDTGWLVLASGDADSDDSDSDDSDSDDSDSDDSDCDDCDSVDSDCDDSDSDDSDSDDSDSDDSDSDDSESDDSESDDSESDDSESDDSESDSDDSGDYDDDRDDDENDYDGGGDTGGGDTGGGDTGGGGTGGGDTGGGGGAATPSKPTPGETPTVSGAQAGRPVSTDPAVRPQVGSGGGSWSRAVSTDDNPFDPYFENNVSPKNLAKILAYFRLLDRFAALPDDGQVDIVWLEFERKPSLKGLSVVIDGTAQAPDLSSVAGKLAVLVFLDQSTLTKGSDVVAVFGNADADGANMAKRRPLR